VSDTKNSRLLISAAPPRSLIAGTSYTLRAIWEHRELLVLLVRRELKAKYKDSSLGFIWSLLRPLVQLVIYYVAIGKFLGAERSIPDFAIYVFTGLTVWTLYSEIVSLSTTSIVANSGLIKKVYVPRELFPLASIGSALFNFVVQMVILVGAILIFARPPLSFALLYLPLGFVTLVAFGTMLGLLLAALNVYLRDIQHLVEVLLIVLFWASPIVYSYQMVHRVLQGGILEQIYLANPVTLVVLAFQKALWAGGINSGVTFPQDIGFRLLAVLGISIVLLWVSQRIFARLEGNFAQEL